MELETLDQIIAMVAKARRDAAVIVRAAERDMLSARPADLAALEEVRDEAAAERDELAAALKALKQRRASLAEPVPA